MKVESEPDQRRNPISASDSNAMHEDDIRHIVRNGIGRDTRVHPQVVDACPPALNPASRWLPHRRARRMKANAPIAPSTIAAAAADPITAPVGATLS